MASNSLIKINGRGHLLCLSRNLQSCWEEEQFTDVYLSGYTPCDDAKSKPCLVPLKANRAVLAAASPVLANILKETIHDEEASLVFSDYSLQDVTNLLLYIYTGNVTLNSENKSSFNKLLEDLDVGSRKIKSPVKVVNSVEKPEPAKETKTKQPSSVNEMKVSLIEELAPIRAKKRSKPLPVQKRPPIGATKAEVTLEEFSGFAGYVPTGNFCLEASLTKFDVLPSTPTHGGIMELPKLADRLGIYSDPHLFNYYRGLIRSLPPIRIFLEISEDSGSDDEDPLRRSCGTMKKPKIEYPAKKNCYRKTYKQLFESNRLPVKTAYCSNGKTHLILNGPIPAPWTDTSIKPILYPYVRKRRRDNNDIGSDSESEEEEDVEEAIEAESRRKRVLLTTLSRLKKDHGKAKRLARLILEASTQKKTCDVEEDECGTISEPEQVMEVNLAPSPPPKESARKERYRMVVCEICGKLISSSWIKAHFANHKESEKDYLCERCGRSFSSATLLKSHVHYQHNSKIRRLECTVCKKTFTKKSRLDIHMRIHNDTRPFECKEPGCTKKFHTSGNLKKHILIHTGEKPHVCHICDKSFAQATNLKLHMKTHQQLQADRNKGTGQSTGSRPRKPEAVYRCEFCPMTFSRVRHFNVHRANHTGQPVAIPCQLCEAQFETIHQLKQHKQEQHPGTVHQCSFCEKSFFKKTALQKHSIERHGPTGEPPLPKPVFACSQCSSTFTTSAARTIHERVHTGERPFNCTQCYKSFTSKYNFRQHLRMHSEERPYKCPECDKAFRQPQHLRAHSYTHKTQEEKVPCPICGKEFKNKILVMSHKRIHKQQSNRAALELQQQQEEEATNETLEQQPHQQTSEQTFQFVDNMGFVSILVLTDGTEEQ